MSEVSVVALNILGRILSINLLCMFSQWRIRYFFQEVVSFSYKLENDKIMGSII